MPLTLPDRRHAILAAVRAIVLAGLREDEADVYLFGSWARQAEAQSSDIDIAIDPRRPLALSRLSALREALEESTIPFRVDLVNLAEAGPAFRARVLKEGVKWTG